MARYLDAVSLATMLVVLTGPRSTLNTRRVTARRRRSMHSPTAASSTLGVPPTAMLTSSR